MRRPLLAKYEDWIVLYTRASRCATSWLLDPWEIKLQSPCMDFPCSSEDPETAWKTVLPVRPWLRLKILLRYSFLSQQAGYSWQIDHLGTLILSTSFCWILTAVDTFSRLVPGILMHSTDSGHTRQVYKVTFFLFGFPEHILSYNRSGFVAQATHEWVGLWNIDAL